MSIPPPSRSVVHALATAADSTARLNGLSTSLGFSRKKTTVKTISRLSFVLSALLLSACSSPTAPERVNIVPAALAAVIAAPVVTPQPGEPAPPAAPVAAGCSDRLDSSWWWEKPTGVHYFNGCDKPLNYVLAHFRVNAATWSSDQTLLSITEERVQAGAYGRQHTTNVTECSQLDLYVGITIDDINSGRVTIHPKDEGKPHFVSVLEGQYGSLGVACAAPSASLLLAPPPPPPPPPPRLRPRLRRLHPRLRRRPRPRRRRPTVARPSTARH